MAKFNTDKEAMLMLVDIVRDLNKSISVIADNHPISLMPFASVIVDVAEAIGNDLNSLTEYFEDTPNELE